MPILATPLGNIQLSIREECLSELKFTQQQPEGDLTDPLLLEAKKQLDEGKVGEFQDEIVYLWALSEYKSAKKSEKYERKAQYYKALEAVKELKKISFKKSETLTKLENLEAKMNAKNEKLKK